MDANEIAFKIVLQHAASIHSWSPTPQNLREIAIAMVSQWPMAAGDVANIVTAIVPRTVFLSFEGIDNSDINLLLSMARKIAEKPDA